MVIMGIDPGYAITGVGIIKYEGNSFKVLEYTAATSPAGMSFPNRLDLIYEQLDALMKKWRPQAMAIEKLFFNTNSTTAIGVAEARGIAELAAYRNGAEVYEYTPLQVKSAVVGYGKAVKTQVQEMTRIILNLKSVPKPDDVADALAIAICHAHSAGSLLGKLQIAAKNDRNGR